MHYGLLIKRKHRLLVRAINKKRYRGIEPLASVWKTEVLPLYEYRNLFANQFYSTAASLSIRHIISGWLMDSPAV